MPLVFLIWHICTFNAVICSLRIKQTILHIVIRLCMYIQCSQMLIQSQSSNILYGDTIVIRLSGYTCMYDIMYVGMGRAGYLQEFFSEKLIVR